MRSLPQLKLRSSARCSPCRLKNPLSLETEVMRTSLVPGLLASLLRNYHRGTSSVRLYELGRLYLMAGQNSSLMQEIGLTHWQVSGTRRRSWVHRQRKHRREIRSQRQASKHQDFLI